jgi:hypothetical protein
VWRLIPIFLYKRNNGCYQKHKDDADNIDFSDMLYNLNFTNKENFCILLVLTVGIDECRNMGGIDDRIIRRAENYKKMVESARSQPEEEREKLINRFKTLTDKHKTSHEIMQNLLSATLNCTDVESAMKEMEDYEERTLYCQQLMDKQKT